MNGFELFQLGRLLMKIGEDATGLATEQASAAVDKVLATALGTRDPAEVAAVVVTLEELAERLSTRRSAGGPGALSGLPPEWDAMYAPTPPWDIGRAQPAFQQLAERGAFRGRVLDVGCGTGEHVLMAAGLGLAATGVDAAPSAIARAENKAEERGLTARFLVGDALELGALGEQFDTVLDSGLFHVFDDENRARFVEGLRAATAPGGRYFMLCFSDRQPGGMGPRRVTQDEIRSGFAHGWRVDSIEPATFDIRVDPRGAQAWLAVLTRTE